MSGAVSNREPPGAPLVAITTLAELVALTASTHGIFLRYSTGPARDAADCRSRDRESGIDMPGLVVTPLAPEPWWPGSAEEWMARRLHRCCGLGEQARGRQSPESDCFAWLLTGTVIGHSLDLEPLVTHFRPLARIHPAVLEEAARLYEQQFFPSTRSEQ
ncbi:MULTISPECIES: DUF6098 family protein [unclassified Rhodococcus (in: high G+C Gram-positive bacteria)]|uniref:DUF6098 family protein n=1 Tax=unclassified Rhodococcus (in: high G+C Gram-positive bacteria) TaxID=192944 RepID=UPI000E2E0541|nr:MULTISPECIES: DUF6098 family protein [unclassified Rhodococcus (in: high G+C Gram-positive bacteria)]RDI21120.1 hypothetical protein DEU38_11561 [Rhodococcus sp. AG1013]